MWQRKQIIKERERGACNNFQNLANGENWRIFIISAVGCIDIVGNRQKEEKKIVAGGGTSGSIF